MGQRLGQHFLTRPEIAAWVADAAELAENGLVLEIGPGHGILTRELVRHARRVVAVEKDPALVRELSARFSDEISLGTLVLIESDIRTFDPAACPQLAHAPYVLAANIPYYLTGHILRSFLTSQHQPDRMALLVQREVAERVVAKQGKQSILSLSVTAYGTPEYVRTVKAGSFSPPPKVDSAILRIRGITRDRFRSPEEEKRFFALVHAGFSSKRKQLAGTLRGLATPERMEACGIPSHARPEDIPFTAWQCLSKD